MDFSQYVNARRVFGVVLAIEVLVTVLVSGGVIPVAQPISITNTLLSTILATVSAYILYSQVDLQRRQLDIEEKMLAYETEPSLEVVKREFRGDDVLLEIANYGHGIAEDLTLVCQVNVDSVDWFNGDPSRESLKRYDSNSEEVFEDSSIRPQETPETFVAESITVDRIPLNETEPDSAGFQPRMMELADETEGCVEISLHVEAHSKVEEIGSISEEAGDTIRVSLSMLPETPNIENVSRFQE